MFLGIVIWAFYQGFKKGLVHSIFALLALFCGVIGALKFSHLASVYVQEYLHVASQYLPLVSFLLVFLLIVLIVRLISNLFEGFLKFIHLGLINKVVGGIFWGMLIIFLFSTVLWFLNQATLISPELKTASKVYVYLEPISPWIINGLGQVFPFLNDLYESLEGYFDSLYAHHDHHTIT